MRRLTLTLTAGLAFSTGCYYGFVDPDASGAYVCGATEECPEGQVCFNGTCLSDEGPSLEIFGPEPFSRIASDDTMSLASFNMTLRGSGLTLTDGNAAVEGEGHLRVYIDGDDQFGRIESGNLSSGLNTEAIDITDLAVGPHRIRVRAFYSNGDPYPNPSSSADSMFFVDDGTPQIAIVEPKPGHVQRIDSDMAVTIAAINWTWNAANSPLAENEGHTHVYSLPNYPACLAVEETSDEYCNNFYLASFSTGVDPDNAILMQGVVTVDNLALLSPGTHPFQAGLQSNEHDPFPSVDASPSESSAAER